MPEAAALARAIRPRPRDLPALAALVRHGSTLAGVGLWAVHRSADHPLLFDDDGAVTGAELGTAVQRIMAAIGDPPPRAVAILGDHRGLVAVIIAAGALGIDLTLLSPRAGDQARRQALADDVGVILHDGPLHAPVTATGRTVDVRAALLRPDSVVPRPRKRPAAAALVVHSSGSTGAPHSRTERSVGWPQVPTVISLAAALGARRGEPMLVAAPLSHGHGLSALAAGLLVGAPVLLGASRHGDHGRAAIVDHRVATWVGLPTQLADLMSGPDSPRLPLRRIVVGSAPTSTALVEQVRAIAGEVLVNYYGTTESGTVTIARPADLTADPATVGRPATGVTLEIQDVTGQILPRGEVGQVMVCSPWRAAGEHPWTHTGDRGRLDAAGRLTLAGRGDGTVIVGGHRVNLREVAAWLERQPGVDRVEVTAVADTRLGEVLHARVAGQVDLADLHARARAELGDAAAPRELKEW
ncbi:class I adenylate-forming enzyme family protein [Ruania halotolerans]|uniref:class I adenylate-forming enzyme family protein n=1 Tax=Ruania halotolerans TaxID=2897773 RepID=UPI001E3B69A2|nr:AMP-binding protein [Ruania halotolerans]UFU05253.1 AMP-binding protein [Ruania halotolerans]